MESVAQAWLVYRLTGSSALLGLVAFAGQIPVLLLGPVAGHLADRLPRRAIILFTQSTFCVIDGSTIASPWPIRQVCHFAKSIGAAGTSLPSSEACSR